MFESKRQLLINLCVDYAQAWWSYVGAQAEEVEEGYRYDYTVERLNCEGIVDGLESSIRTVIGEEVELDLAAISKLGEVFGGLESAALRQGVVSYLDGLELCLFDDTSAICDRCNAPLIPNISTWDSEGLGWTCITLECSEYAGSEVEVEDLVAMDVPEHIATWIVRLIDQTL